MRFTKTPSIVLAGTAVVALGTTGCAAAATTSGAAGAGTTVPAAHVHAKATTTLRPVTTVATASSAQHSAIDVLTQEARQRYREETQGAVVHAQLNRIAGDQRMLALLRGSDMNALRRYVRGEFNSVWYHRHVSRMRIVRGSRMLVDVGVPFVVAPAEKTLRDAQGHVLGTLQVSIQDVIGFVRYMHRKFPVDVVVRGKGQAHVRSSLPAATSMTLPSSGTVTVGGRRMAVRSFPETALGNEPVTVWILAKA